MESVDEILIIGIGVDGRHESVFRPNASSRTFARGEAVRSARGVRDDEVTSGVELILIDTDPNVASGF